MYQIIFRKFKIVVENTTIFYIIGKIDFLSKIAAKSVQKWLKCIYKQMFEYYNILTRR